MRVLTLAKPKPIHIPDWAIDLAKKASEIGYQYLNYQIDRSTKFVEGVAALKAEGVDVFSPESVRRYKRFAIILAKFKLSKKSLLLGLLCSLLFFLSVANTPMEPKSTVEVLFGVGDFLFFVLAGLCFARFGYDMISEDSERAGRLNWSVVPLSAYHKPIPIDILQTAVQLREKFGPDVQLFVDELERRKVVVDPFLLVTFGQRDDFRRQSRFIRGEEFYVAVWNEPKFKGLKL